MIFPSKEDLNAIKMPDLDLLSDKEYKEYYEQKAGENHYRLLHWFSWQYDNKLFLDIGTMRGTSALALSAKSTNSVISYDVKDRRDSLTIKKNIQFKIGYCIDNKEDIDNATIILLDIPHFGFEFEVLKEMDKFQGILIIDDIHLDPVKQEFWDQIKKPKEDLTNIGHFSGTGIVFWSNS